MQQYRVNYSLLIGLLVGTLVCSGAVFGLWKFQIERKSGWLISEAEKAIEAGDNREAVQLYKQYLTINSGDIPTRIRFANALADLSEQDDAKGEELNMAWRSIEGLVRDRTVGAMPEAEGLRRRLVELYGRDNVRRFPDALDHLSYMLERKPDDAELQILRAKYLVRSGNTDDAAKYSYKLIGYDPESDSFDEKKATAPHEAEVYSSLAVILRTKQDKPELADRVMDQLVEVNPKSAPAYLSRGGFRDLSGDSDSAKEDFEKAYELDPKGADVLLAMASQSTKDKEYEKANEYLAAGKKLHPQDARFYQSAADVAVKQEDYKKALAQVDEGLKTIKGQKGHILLILKADLQFHANDLKGVKQTMEEMTRAEFRAEFVDWYAARVLLAEQNWYDASEALNKLRPKVTAGFGDLPIQIDNFLGLCYEKLGQPDLAAELYNQVLAQDPKNEPALAGRTRVRTQRGLEPEDGKGEPFAQAVEEELKKPKSEQNWSRVEEIMKDLAKKRNMDDASLKVWNAQLALMREDFDGATKALAEANGLSPNNLLVHRMAVQVARLNPKVGPAIALQRWQKVFEQFGDSPVLRLDKADILIALNNSPEKKEQLKPELAELLTGIDDWTTAQKTELWGGMTGRYLNLGMPEEARQYLAMTAENQPNELPLRLSLFALALQANDDAGMNTAQDKILEIVGSKNDSNWLYTEARRMLSLIRRGQLGQEALGEIRQLASRALQQRPEWHELHLIKAEIEVHAGNALEALNHYDRAQSLGRPNAAEVAQHLRLLCAVGRFEDAGKFLDRIPEGLRRPYLGQLYPEILFRTNQVESAIENALAATEADPTSPQNQYWYGQLLARSAQGKEAGSAERKKAIADSAAAFKKAVELQPEFPEAWYALIALHVSEKDLEGAQAALREAQLSLSGDNLQMFLAKSYETLGRWFDAETMYRAVYDAAPDDLNRTQQLAAFYMSPIYQRPDRQQKVAPLINKIIRAGAEKKLQPNDPGLLWARRTGAKLLAASTDYQSLVKAENMLASNSQDGSLSIEDKLEMAGILAPRPEPLSRLKAIDLLEEVSEIQPLNEQGEIALAQLYEATGDTSKYTRQMEKAIARFQNSTVARQAYANNLLKRDDQRSIAEATKQVTKLRQLAPNSPSTFQLTVRLADKVGKQAQIRGELLKLVPDFKTIKEISPQQGQQLAMLAGLFVEVGDLDTAERIYRELATRDPNLTPALAAFLGQHRDVEQSFAKLDEIYSVERIPQLLQVAMATVRQQRDKVGDKFDEQIQRWLDAGLRENPDSINLLIVQADLFDLQKKYDESAKVYRQLLDRKDLTGVRRAIVLNNLSFLVALAGTQAEANVDPLKLVDEAASIMGPNSDILDTRAVVLTALKRYDDAIHDLELSVTDNPTASKYFHKADAHLRAGQNRAAVDAWEKAEELDLSRDTINRMEFDRYEEMKSKIDQIRGASVTQAEPRRRAS